MGQWFKRKRFGAALVVLIVLQVLFVAHVHRTTLPDDLRRVGPSDVQDGEAPEPTGEERGESVPPVFVVTPTYFHPNQIPHLMRLCNTLRGLPNLHWLIVEDAPAPSPFLDDVLEWCQDAVSSIHHLAARPQGITEHRGVVQRNKAIEAVLGMVEGLGHGVVYFADDDNTYDLRLFSAVRSTRRVKVWPVGLISNLQFEGPICDQGRVVQWRTAWGRDRTFPLDMAGFAVNTSLLLERGVRFDPHSKRGFMESDFLSKLVGGMEDLEPVDDCRVILAWHTQTRSPDLSVEKKVVEDAHDRRLLLGEDQDEGEEEEEEQEQVLGVPPDLTKEEYEHLTGSSNKAHKNRRRVAT